MQQVTRSHDPIRDDDPFHSSNTCKLLYLKTKLMQPMSCDALIRGLHARLQLKTACGYLSSPLTQVRTRSTSKCNVKANMESDSQLRSIKAKPVSNKVLLVVAAALIDIPSKTVLLAERPSKKHLEGLYEFPGGKVEPDESPEEALVRELREELGIHVESKNLYPLTFASHSYEEKGFHLLMPLYACSSWEGKADGKENQRLVWCSTSQIQDDTYKMPPADYPLIQPLVKYMESLFSS